VYNKCYNPNGKHTARSYKFPYEDDSFDFVFLTSVFTHMLLEDTEHYLAEVSRVLKPLGRCLSTFFLLNEESRALILARKSRPDFAYELDGAFTTSQETPEAAIAVLETAVKSMFERYRLRLLAPVHYGSWCGRANYLSYQDILISEKLIDGQ
jgi:ubiquinone/menaquinone biosynthesis C-methylase UbiE